MQKVSCNSKIVYLASIQNIASQINFILFSDKNITAYYWKLSLFVKSNVNGKYSLTKFIRGYENCYQKVQLLHPNKGESECWCQCIKIENWQ